MKKQPPEMFFKKFFAKFTGKHLRQSLFFNKVEYKNNFFREHLWATTSVYDQTI